jgi:RNA recognition motif-containing protein
MSRVYVGRLPNTAEKADLQREFSRFGAIRDIWVARNPPGFAFVEYEDSRDAEVSSRSSCHCGSSFSSRSIGFFLRSSLIHGHSILLLSTHSSF